MEFQWGNTVRIDMSPHKAKMIIKKYVTTNYPQKSKQYDQYLINLKQKKLQKYSHVTFTQNNLMWQDNQDTLQKKLNILEFSIYCKNLILANRKDWRVPTYSELLGLVHYKKIDPATLKKVHFVQSDKYWSVSKKINKVNSSWYVDFNDGTTGVESNIQRHNIRCVRQISQQIGEY